MKRRIALPFVTDTLTTQPDIIEEPGIQALIQGDIDTCK
jgi:hypothetical protein